jgi:hypothetical protein
MVKAVAPPVAVAVVRARRAATEEARPEVLEAEGCCLEWLVQRDRPARAWAAAAAPMASSSRRREPFKPTATTAAVQAAQASPKQEQ